MLTSLGRIFLLSPAKAGGPRYSMLVREQADFDLAKKLRDGAATIGEVYSFISGLYFRGKMAYAEAFRAGPPRVPDVLVIVPGAGLISPETTVDVGQLRAIAEVSVDEANPAFCGPLVDSARLVDRHAQAACSYVLLGSVATGKYTKPLLDIFGDRLLFPADFVGRGDMSRGGLMLRQARARVELPYIPVQGALLHGARPPRLEKWRKRDILRPPPETEPRA
ncbi:MAG: hypothetical protein JO061_09955 [Acidobacteriaceae bacterium]|nr:hypothetical protein [Acidobacteriaceae bacterium]